MKTSKVLIRSLADCEFPALSISHDATSAFKREITQVIAATSAGELLYLPVQQSVDFDDATADQLAGELQQTVLPATAAVLSRKLLPGTERPAPQRIRQSTFVQNNKHSATKALYQSLSNSIHAVSCVSFSFFRHPVLLRPQGPSEVRVVVEKGDLQLSFLRDDASGESLCLRFRKHVHYIHWTSTLSKCMFGTVPHSIFTCPPCLHFIQKR